ncbi:MAG: tetratricopeptide repeat protein [Gammaproteobacteria bacterium]|jgi:TPR repeat protein
MTESPDDIMDFNSGIAAFEAKHFSRAMKLLSPIAESGSAEAQYRLAIMYQNGLGVVRNELLAYKWMKSAAAKEYGPALHGLGFMYMEGDCVDRDDSRAVKCFEAAVAQGLEGAMVALAQLLEQGRGAPADPERAQSLYAQAGF